MKSHIKVPKMRHQQHAGYILLSFKGYFNYRFNSI